MNIESGIARKLVRVITRDRRSNRPLVLLACIVLLLAGPTAHADCVRTTILPDTVVTFPATITIPRDAPNGVPLATVTVPVAGATAGLHYGNCSGSGKIYWNIAAGPNIPNRVGATSVPGIGYTSSLSGGGFGSALNMDTALNAENVPGGFATPTLTDQLYVTVSLVKTGPVTPGQLSLNPTGPGISGRVATFFVGDAGLGLFNVAVPGNITSVVAGSCSVTTPSVNVAIPQAYAGKLSTGATTGATPFSLSANCTAGTSVYVTLTDASDVSNRSTTLGLAPGSSATGVGLQILNGSTPIAYGPDSAATGNTNQWLAGTAAGGPMTIPLTVQYVRTPGALTPGTVKGTATFTMSYQ